MGEETELSELITCGRQQSINGRAGSYPGTPLRRKKHKWFLLPPPPPVVMTFSSDDTPVISRLSHLCLVEKVDQE